MNTFQNKGEGSIGMQDINNNNKGSIGMQDK